MKKKILALILAFVLCFSVLFVTPVSAKEFLRGDINFDGTVGVSDLLIMRKFLVGMIELADESLLTADCDGDLTVNTQDLLTLRKYLAKQGDLYKEPTWTTLRDWEVEADGDRPSKVTLPPAFNAVVTGLDGYGNAKNNNSKQALIVKVNGVYYGSDSTKKGTNPTCAYNATQNAPLKIQLIANNTDTILQNATNLRVALKHKPVKDELSVIYVGFSFKGVTNFYYTRLTLESYNDFNYFYFADKDYVKVDNSGGKRRTFLPDEQIETLTLTKDKIKDIKYLCFWMESDKGTAGAPFYIDDIEMFEGANGYDSTAEDSALKQPEAPVNDGKKKYIAISFDDGPQIYSPSGRHYMEYYMDVAAEYGAKFSYFVGANNLTDDDIPTLKRAVAEGHALENHTIGHNRLTDLSAEAGAEKITAVDDWLIEKVGVETNYIRPPFIAVNANAYNAMKLAGMKAAIAGPCPQDYNEPSVDYKELYYEKHLGDGVISLNHEHYIDNVETIRRLLEHFTARGYEFVTISELAKIRNTSLEKGAVYYSLKP